MAKLEMNKNTPLEFGLYSLGDHLLNPFKGEKVSYEQRINEIIEASKLADEAGIDVFAVGESHQEHFYNTGTYGCVRCNCPSDKAY